MIAYPPGDDGPPCHGPQRQAQAGRPVLEVKRWPWALGLLALGWVLALAAAWYWHNETRELHDEAYARLEAIGASKVRELLAWRSQHAIDAARLAREARAVLELQAHGLVDARQWLQRRAEFEVELGQYADVWILDETGQIMAAQARRGQRPEASQAAWRDAAEARGGVVAPVHLDASGSARIDSVAAIRDAQGRVLGYVQLRCDVANHLAHLMAYWPGIGGEGAASLVQRDGPDALFVAGVADREGRHETKRVPLERSDVVAVQALLGGGPRLQGLDHAARPVVAIAHAIAGTPWTVVTRLDRSRLTALALDRARDVLMVVGAMLMATALTVAALYRRRQEGLLLRWGEQRAAGETFVRSVLDSLTAHLAVLDADGRILAVNEGWRSFGRDNGASAQLTLGVGQDYLASCTTAAAAQAGGAAAPLPTPQGPQPDDGATGTDASTGIRDVLAGRSGSWSVEYRCDAPGQPRWFSMRVSPLAGPLGGAVVAHVDITARKRAELEAAAHARHMSQVVAALPAAVYTCAADGTITMFNEAAVRLWGCRPALGEARWRGPVRVLDEWGRDVKPDGGAMGQALRSGRPVGRCAYTMERPDGQRRIVEPHAVPFVDEQGRVFGGLNMLVDLTEHRGMEQALRRSLAEKEALLKEVHHRVKNNLQVVSSLLRLEAGRADTPQSTRVLRGLQDRVRAMALLHESLYRSSDLAQVDLPSYLHELLVRLLRAHAPSDSGPRLQFEAQSASLTLEQALPCGLIVSELASNALRHALGMRRGSLLWLTLQAPPVGTRGELVLRLADDGPGIAQDRSTDRCGALGLRLVDDLASQLQATLSLRSGARTLLGRGTEFELRMPYPHAVADARADHSRPAAALRSEPREAPA